MFMSKKITKYRIYEIIIISLVLTFNINHFVLYRLCYSRVWTIVDEFDSTH